MATKCGKCFISPLVLFPESLRSVEGIFDANNAENSLYEEINAEDAEPGLSPQVVVVFGLIAGKLLSRLNFTSF